MTPPTAPTGDATVAPDQAGRPAPTAGLARGPVEAVGLVVHPGLGASIALARRLVTAFGDHGVDVVVADQGSEPARIGCRVADEDFADGLGLVLSIGGDGTFLRAAHLVRDAEVPLLGVNLGRLGFLAEVDPETIDQAMPRIVAGDWRVRDRCTLDMTAVDGAGAAVGIGWALNEVSVEKSAREHMLRMDVLVDGHRFTRVGADAMIVASTTGSTAYALSAGGPIVSPQLDAMLVVPVAPHTLFDRTLVTSTRQQVTVALATDQEPAVVSCDGRRPLMVPPGGRVEVTGASVPVRVARLGPRPFPELVRTTFRLD